LESSNERCHRHPHDRNADAVRLHRRGRRQGQGGGCSGFQYGFTFDEAVNEDDTVMDKSGVQLLVDSMSYQYLVGAEIDYKDDLNGAQFVIKNPNATTTCGCGSSFSV
jgi:iron-sulfur cluster insertion protein